jgi:hypothetical protein
MVKSLKFLLGSTGGGSVEVHEIWLWGSNTCVFSIIHIWDMIG